MRHHWAHIARVRLAAQQVQILYEDRILHIHPPCTAEIAADSLPDEPRSFVRVDSSSAHLCRADHMLCGYDDGRYYTLHMHHDQAYRQLEARVYAASWGTSRGINDALCGGQICRACQHETAEASLSDRLVLNNHR